MPLQRSLHKNLQLTKQTQQPLSKNSPRQLFNIMYILNQKLKRVVEEILGYPSCVQEFFLVKRNLNFVKRVVFSIKGVFLR